MAERTDDRSDVAVQPKSDDIRRGIESTRASLDEKLDALERRVRQVQTKAKQVVDLGHQARMHPWWIFGASVALGFAAGLLSSGRRRGEPRGRGAAAAENARRLSAMHSPMDPPVPMRVEVFDTIKLAARSAIADLARQALLRAIPSMVQQLNKAWQKDEPAPGGALPEGGHNGRVEPDAE